MDEQKKTQAEELAGQLSYKKTNFFEASDEAAIQAAYGYATGYMDYLNRAKTEREATRLSVRMAEAHGYTPYTFGMKLEVGGKY